MEEPQQHQKQAAVAIVPSLGMGHVIPLIAFAKLLASRYDFSITLLLPSPAQTQAHQPSPAQLSILQTLPHSISCTFLPPLAQIPENPSPGLLISLNLTHSLSSIRAELARRARVLALVTDLFGGDVLRVGNELGIPSYVYCTSNAMCMQFAFQMTKLDETVSCEYSGMPDPFIMPGCVPLRWNDLPDFTRDRKSEGYRIVLHHMKSYMLAHGIFVNSFYDLEPTTVRALQTEDPNRPPIYPIGPVILPGSGCIVDGFECLKWLDQQPNGSVLFVSFGSEGVLSSEQVRQLANGLELSGLRFLWVVRSPNDDNDSICVKEEINELGYLPNGFIDRTRDRALLVPSWAPQIEILSHTSIGGFLTHCGWNSTIEAIINGVPLIVWPLYAEQKMNSVLLNQGLEVGLRLQEGENGIVEANVIAKVVKELMEGEEGKRVQNKMKELSNMAKRAIGENGASTKTLDEVALKWRDTQIQEC